MTRKREIRIAESLQAPSLKIFRTLGFAPSAASARTPSSPKNRNRPMFLCNRPLPRGAGFFHSVTVSEIGYGGKWLPLDVDIRNEAIVCPSSNTQGKVQRIAGFFRPVCMSHNTYYVAYMVSRDTIYRGSGGFFAGMHPTITLCISPLAACTTSCTGGANPA